MAIEKILDKIKKYVYFAECLAQTLGKTPLCRVSWSRHSAKTHAVNYRYVLARFCRVSSFAECSTLGKIFFAECFIMPSARHSANDEFTVCFPLPSVALGKEDLYRVPDILRSANIWTLGKVLVSGSEHCSS
jgi:hypothetical protein